MKLVTRTNLLALPCALGVIAATCTTAPGGAAAQVPAHAPASPERAVMDVAHGLAEARPVVLWDALPAGYQQDLTELIHAFAAKVDADLWNKGFQIVRKTGTMLKNQKDNILAMPKVRQSPDFDAEQASRQWDLVVAPIMTIADSEVANIESLRTIDVRRCLDTTGTRVMQDLIRIGEFTSNDAADELAALGDIQVTLVSQSGDTAVLEIALPGESVRTQKFLRVEGKWVPADLAALWETGLQQARDNIAQMSNDDVQKAKPQIMALLGNIESTIDQLDRARSPEQFEQTMQMGMFQVFGGAMAIAQAMESGQE